jgi:AraC-like DNA-binding protein
VIRIAQGECFVLNPAQAHACHSSEPHAYTVVSVGAEIMANAFRRTTAANRQPFFPCIRLADAQLADCFGRFRADSRDSDGPAAWKSNMDWFLDHLAGCHAVPDCRSVPGQPDHLAGVVARVCSFVAAHAEEKLSMTRLAGVARISPGYFQRTFVRMTGISAHDYLMQCRIRKARQLLENGAEPGDVAQATGFFDQSHFSRVFRDAVGTTPGRYARWHVSSRNQAACSPLSVSACSSGA